MDNRFYKISFRTSRMITKSYSTSFAIGVRCLHSSIRDAIHSIYGFVRFADEIVDSFHEYDREKLLSEFEKEYDKAFQYGISLNPVLNAFQLTVKKYSIPDELIRSFLKSMKSDIYKSQFGNKEIEEYIYGSAEVVGLMCLKVFVGENDNEYNRLKPHAMRLGAAFQKINFLRDIRHDTQKLNRTYFPVLRTEELNEKTKRIILDDIYNDYEVALEGLMQLPSSARLGVYTAYLYYLSLTKLIESTPADKLFGKRIRISNGRKMVLFGRAYLINKFN